MRERPLAGAKIWRCRPLGLGAYGLGVFGGGVLISHTRGFNAHINTLMLVSTLFISLSLAVALLVWVVVICVRGVGRQFPTAYQLLRESPDIHRREWRALWGILGLAVVFGLLLLTSLF